MTLFLRSALPLILMPTLNSVVYQGSCKTSIVYDDLLFVNHFRKSLKLCFKFWIDVIQKRATLAYDLS